MPNTPGTLIHNSLIPQTISHHTNARTQPPDVLLRGNLVVSPRRVYRARRQRNSLCTHTYTEISASKIHRETRAGDEAVKNTTKTPESTHNPVKPVFLHESLIINQRKVRWRGDKREITAKIPSFLWCGTPNKLSCCGYI